jgi:protein involved in polysaccharide export with SLBB domain
MSRIALALTVALVGASGCATPPQVYAPVSHQDVREITSVVQQRSDIRKPILRIDGDEVGSVRLTSGRDDTAGAISNTFKMAKRAGHWTIISPIEKEKIIVTSADAHRLH